MKSQIKKKYGQHFLNEKSIIDKIIDIQKIKDKQNFIRIDGHTENYRFFHIKSIMFSTYHRYK